MRGQMKRTEKAGLMWHTVETQKIRTSNNSIAKRPLIRPAVPTQ